MYLRFFLKVFSPVVLRKYLNNLLIFYIVHLKIICFSSRRITYNRHYIPVVTGIRNSNRQDWDTKHHTTWRLFSRNWNVPFGRICE